MAETGKPVPETTMEDREEMMLSPLGGKSTLRRAHFLKPSSLSTETPPPYPLSSNPIISSKDPPLKLKLHGRRYRVETWASWVHQLLPKYHEIWKKAGIFEAVLSSTHQITRTKKLVIDLAEKWNFETNTFVFPWGESTLTLEDMRVLGGYSVLGYPVLGYPVLSPEETREISETEQGLCLAQEEIRKGSYNQTWWMKYFMGSGHILEHEAFLAVWLARYVLPSGYEIDSRKIFPLAIHLSRGTPLALAPAVLASIYRDLSMLKKSIISSFDLTDSEIKHGIRHKIKLWAPFQLLMMWVWERFPTLRPNPNLIQLGDPRSARWHGFKPFSAYNTRAVLDSAGECFQWRPYALALNNWDLNKFYKESEELVLLKPEIDGELASFVLFIRVSELVGLDCIEQYLPHRVAMQFGYDQDIPGDVPRFIRSFEEAWKNYSRPIGDVELYRPARLFESDVTTRYFFWRNESEDEIKICSGNDNQALIEPQPVRCKKKAKMEGTGVGDDPDGELHLRNSSPPPSDSKTLRFKKMKDLIRNDPTKAVADEMSILGSENGLDHPVGATSNKSGEEAICECKCLEKIRVEFDTRFTKIERVIAELKQEILARNH